MSFKNKLSNSITTLLPKEGAICAVIHNSEIIVLVRILLHAEI